MAKEERFGLDELLKRIQEDDDPAFDPIAKQRILDEIMDSLDLLSAIKGLQAEEWKLKRMIDEELNG